MFDDVNCPHCKGTRLCNCDDCYEKSGFKKNFSANKKSDTRYNKFKSRPEISCYECAGTGKIKRKKLL